MECAYTFVRGSKAGETCDRLKVRGSEYCSQHKGQVKRSRKKAKVVKKAKTAKKSLKKKKVKEDRDDCSICMSAVKKKGRCVLKCGHEFHVKCIFDLYDQQTGYRNKCPNCRKEFHKLPRLAPAQVYRPVVQQPMVNLEWLQQIFNNQ